MRTVAAVKAKPRTWKAPGVGGKEAALTARKGCIKHYNLEIQCEWCRQRARVRHVRSCPGVSRNGSRPLHASSCLLKLIT